MGHVCDSRPIVVLQSFSKIYGLVGLRCVDALADPSQCNELRRLKNVVSVVIPTRGRRQELGRLLSSLAAQDCADQLEVIVVDNPLALNRQWLRTASWPFPLGYVHITWPNRGLSRNAGAAVATGQWLLFLDSDVVLSAAAISTLLKSATDLSRTIVMADVVFRRRSRARSPPICSTFPPTSVDIEVGDGRVS